MLVPYNKALAVPAEPADGTRCTFTVNAPPVVLQMSSSFTIVRVDAGTV